MKRITSSFAILLAGLLFLFTFTTLVSAETNYPTEKEISALQEDISLGNYQKAEEALTRFKEYYIEKSEHALLQISQEISQLKKQEEERRILPPEGQSYFLIDITQLVILSFHRQEALRQAAKFAWQLGDLFVLEGFPQKAEDSFKEARALISSNNK